ncbi:hypothetical protein AALB16_03920 [Lachnospiraceae bacterium 62-35]
MIKREWNMRWEKENRIWMSFYQLGGGHGKDYWFHGRKRVREISREAFAGYFEYRATIPRLSMQRRILNPDNCMPYTIAALNGMFNALL